MRPPSRQPRAHRLACAGASLTSCALAHTDSNAPLCTIDIDKLSETRFLFINNGKRLLPFRDEDGKISLSLVLDSQRQVNTGRVTPPKEVRPTRF